ncbi:MAG TPA: hypothetical protein VN752_03460 [Solirubrobacterales bacterium]|nr:hypothetical protein [Solirubrobacterales bacterium]
MAESKIDDLFVELFGNTLGRSIHNVKRILGEHGDWVLADQMANTLKLRNELIHHWMRTRAMLQGTSENRLAMIDELEGVTAKLQTLTVRSASAFRRCWPRPIFLKASFKRNTSA